MERMNPGRSADGTPGLLSGELATPWNHYLVDMPKEVAAVPSMMTVGERKFLYGLARDYYIGSGRIVDAGIFLGATTRCFGAALQQNAAYDRSRWPVPVISFEMAKVNPRMLPIFERHGLADGLVVGDSFAPLIERHIAPVADLIDLRIGDVLQTGHIDDQIEILFLDLVKHEAIGDFVVREWFPRLVPGHSIVVQQDYFLDGLAFLKVHQEFFQSKFAYLGELAVSAVYRCIEEITASDIDRLHEIMKDPDEQLRLHSLAIYRTKVPARQLMMAISRLRLLVSLKGIDAGCEYFSRIEREFATILADPTQPRRVSNAIAGARFLVASKGDKRALMDAQVVSLGKAR